MGQTNLFHKDFTLVVIGQIISLFGNGIVRFALPLYLLNQTKSASLFGLVTALSFIPMIVLMPVGGIIADRVNKRNVMVFLDFMTAGLMLILLLLIGKADLVVLLTLGLMVLYAIQGAYQPTVQASIPLLQDKEQLLPANAIVNQVNALANLIAPIIGGVLFGIWGLYPIIAIAGICFLFSAVMELFIVIPYKKAKETTRVWVLVRGDFSESFSFMRKDKPVIWKSIKIICLFNLFLSAMIMVAMPVIITQTLEMSDELYGFSQGALAAGGLVGGIMTGLFAKKLDIKMIYILLLVCAVLLLPVALTLWLNLLPFFSYIVICVSCSLLMGVSTMVSVQILSFIQGETPCHLTGKVLSCVMALSVSAQPIGQAIYGLLFEIFRDAPYLVILGAVLVSAIIAVFSKHVFQKFQSIRI